MDSKFQSLKEEMHKMHKNYNNHGVDHGSKNDDTPMCERHEANYTRSEDYQNQNSHDSYSHQSRHDLNDFEKSLTELNNDMRNNPEDFKRCIHSMRIVHWKLFAKDVPKKKSKPINQEPQSETDFEKLMTKFLDSQRGEYDMWKLRIEQYFQIQDYDLWDVIENGNSFKPAAQTTTNVEGTSTTLIPGPVTADEKVQKKNDVMARSMLLMALPNEHLLTFNQYKDAKTLFAAIQTRFGGENISQEDLNLIFLRSLPSEWNTHVVVWRNKPDLDTMSFDDLYNNFMIVEQEVKGTASLSSSSQNMAFVSSSSSTNEVNIAYEVSTASTQVSTANLSDATIYAFLANQSNGSQLVHEDLEQIHEDDLEEMDLMWQLALLIIRTRSFDWSYMTDDEVPTNMALMAFSDSKTSKSVSEDTSNEVRESSDASLVEELVSNDKLTAITIKGIGWTKAVNTGRPYSAVVNVVRVNQGHPQKENQGYVESGCSRHMTCNLSYLSTFKEFDGGYVTFGGGAKRGRITGKGTLKTRKLNFEDVYFVKELQFKLFSVSQMCDKKNIFLFIDTRCFVLSPDFKLADESQVLLKVPRKNNIYSVDIKNICNTPILTNIAAEANLRALRGLLLDLLLLYGRLEFLFEGLCEMCWDEFERGVLEIQEVTPDAADNSRPIFDAEPLQKVQNDNDNYNVFANDNEHPEQPESVNDTYTNEQGDTTILTDSLDMSNNGRQAD
ncbi:hypothetical protein Tco_0573452 [Tanacetum coccineum]